ncbi:MAG: hypothetical protein HRU26_07495, partial [Psychroserpens sp.]|nr:hypothetical protein [Psychroserpens sp.]
NGAVLTIDSYPQETAMGLLGQISTNDGIWRIDGRQVKEFAYASGSGSLPAVGDIITDSGGASGKVIFLNSGNASSGVMTVTQQSGVFAASNTLSSGGFSATLSSVKVGYLMFFMEDGNNSGKGLGSLEFLGEWYEVGTGDGTDGQTFNLPHNGTQQAMWVETGLSTGVYERWFRKDSTTAFTDYQTDELGKCFDHAINSNVVTFGTSTNGNTPPAGARIIIPNVHLGTATIASPTTELAADTSGNSMWNIGTNSSLSVTFNKVNASTLNTSFTGLDSVTFQDSCLAVMSAAISNLTINETNIDNCVILGSRDFDGAEGQNIAFTDLSGLNITNSILGAFRDFPVNFNTSSNIVLNNVVINGCDPKHANNNRRVKFSNCSNVTAIDVVGIRAEMLFEVGTSAVRFTNYRFSDGESSTVYTANGQSVFFMQSGANDVVIDGVALIPNGLPPRNDFAEFIDAINCIVRNAGSITNKIDFANQTEFLATFAGVSSGCKLQRVYGENTRNLRSAQYAPTTIDCEMSNCSSGYDRGLIPDSKNTILQGMHGADGSLNGNDGVDVDYPLTAGVHGIDVFTSDTEGRIHAIFTPPTQQTSQYVVLTNGATFNKEGDMLLRTVGDSIEVEVPYLIQGHDSLSNIAPSISGTSTGNIDAEYSLDTGSGFGTFKSATGANLSSETVSASGFKIKFKFTANSSNNGTLINGFFISTTTTLSSQSSNFYPFARPFYGYNFTVANSRMAIFRVSDGSLISKGEDNGSALTQSQVAWESNFQAIKRLRLAGYASIESLITITESGSISAGIQSLYSLIPSTDPNLTSNITITDHGNSPVSWDAGDGSKDYSITIQTDSVGDTFTDVQLLNEINYSISQDADYFGENGFAWPDMLIQAGTNVETARGILFGSLGANLKGVRVVKSDGNTAHPAISRFQSDDGSYGTPPVLASAAITGIVSGSRLQIYNETTSTEVVNTVVNSTSYSAQYTDGTDYSSGDLIRIKLTQISGTTAKAEFSANAVATSQGWSILADQQDDEVYNALGLNGSSINKFTADYVNDQVDIVVGNDFLASEMYAWWVYNLTTSLGISEFFGGITAIDEANFRINNNIVDIQLDNNTSTNVAQQDNRRIFRTDGTRPVSNPTSGGGGIDVEWRSPVTIAKSEFIQNSLSDIYDDTQRVDGMIEDVSGDRFTVKALEQAPAGGGGGGSSDWTNSEKEQIRDALGVAGSKTTASGGQLQNKSEFDPSVTPVTTDTASRDASKADLTSLETKAEADARQVDLIAEHNATQADIANLNDFDPSVTPVTTDTASRDASKADVSGLATQSSVDAIPANVDTELSSNHGSGSWQGSSSSTGATKANQVAMNEALKLLGQFKQVNDNLPDT